MSTSVATRFPLYDARREHDACGTGFIAEISGTPSRRVVTLALQAATRLAHRGARGADDETGDGGGIMTDIPRALFARFAEESCSYHVGENDTLAVGMIFTTRKSRQALLGAFRKHADKARFKFLGARDVPINRKALGKQAQATCPLIIQVFLIVPPGTERPVESELFLLRKAVESEFSRIKDTFICSLSSRIIVYKGLIKAENLDRFYPDLIEPDYLAKVALFHERFSTNTLPNWHMAQPFRMLAHNGEINTIKSNRLWMQAREREMQSQFWGSDLETLKPIVTDEGSDSFSLDNVLEFLMRSGRGMFRSLMMMLPEPYRKHPNMDPALRDFYVYHENLMEAWDGPAALVVTDGNFVGAKMDRNGLRPLRYTVTKDGLVVMASEAGVVDVTPENLVFHHHMMAGELFSLALDGRGFMENAAIKTEVSSRAPYTRLIADSVQIIARRADRDEFDELAEPHTGPGPATLAALGWSGEDLDRYLMPMGKSGREPLGSMGDDTPPAIISRMPRRFYDYFKHAFAQVTNPPIDPIRERSVTSLRQYLGGEGNLLGTKPTVGESLRVESPVLSPRELALLASPDTGFRARTFSSLMASGDRIEPWLEGLLGDCEQAVSEGYRLLIFSDEGISPDTLPVPMPLIISAVHNHLIKQRVRSKVSLICRAGDLVEDHHVAVLISLGASAIYPYMAYRLIRQYYDEDDWAAYLGRYRYSLEEGLIKIMAKSGISTISSYHGGMLLHVMGLSAGILDRYFPSLSSPIGGIGLEQLQTDLARRTLEAFGGSLQRLADHGRFQYRKKGEKHGFAPDVFKSIGRQAADSQVDGQPPPAAPVYLRHFFDFKATDPVPADQVEGVEGILKRFGSGAMSLGAVSEEVHRTLATALHRVGARSNTGEGGEQADRYALSNPDKSVNSFVKQIASARFGVTTAYLSAAREIQIKIAQGAKPGEGGQLPGRKVTMTIASVRNSTLGVPLISPPPHHDIYSIEDIAQLIYDLKQVNPRAAVSVKLVSQPGVGTIAAGVVKAGADIVLVAGGDGGTGASPLGSIKHTGLPWELGLAEVHQTLTANGLRSRCTLRVDGGLKNGRDVVMAATLGAEEFDFGSALLVSLGCIMARQCHLNTCPTGIATQDETLRKRFKAGPEQAVNYLTAVANQVRALLAEIGAYGLGSIIGRTDILTLKREHAGYARERGLNFDTILNPAASEGLPLPTAAKYRPEHVRAEQHLDHGIIAEIRPRLLTHDHVVVRRDVCNQDRAVGTRLAGELAFLFGEMGFHGNIQMRLRGIAGQSFGAFLTTGIELRLRGAANDYVAKGMSGGMITIRFEKQVREQHATQTIIGNVALYGATGGTLLVAGAAGERFAVRNSGALAIVEGAGNHCCEYMTRGTVVILGRIGLNFGAGMSGGAAYVYCTDPGQLDNLNREYVRDTEPTANDLILVLRVLREHLFHTGSEVAKNIIGNWEEAQGEFVKIVPLALDRLDYEKIYDHHVEVRFSELLNE
ncbi:MAG: glutamate synthase large subunit [Candidatus Marinimicrobia bacterium]|nr:glutamate synthase large subunit [Candidatus Neomarinimicrobiota bacterium]